MMNEKQRLAKEAREHLEQTIIQFWKKLRDDQYGGYYGWLSYDLELDKKSSKGLYLKQQDHMVLLQCIYRVKKCREGR